MPEFMLSVHHDYTKPLFEEGTDLAALQAAVASFNASLQEAGVWVYANGLEAPGAAVVVSAESGETLISQGPAAKLPPSLGGFWVIDVADMESGTTWAQRASIAVRGPIELRPFQS